MLILKEFSTKKRKNDLQTFEDLYCGDVKIGHTTTNIFKVATQTGNVDYPTVKPFMFKFDIGLQSNLMPIIYSWSVDECRNEAIEVFRDFLNRFLK